MNLKANKLNVIVSVSFKVITIIVNFVLRSIFVRYLGIEVQGLATVFVSILGFLGIIDLGIGTAISYAMYAPISEKKQSVVGALYGLYKKIYLIIGGIIIVGGMLVLPFLKGMCNGYSGDINIYFAYLLSLITAVISYLYAADISLIQAHQLNYITTLVSSGALIIEHAVEILILIFLRSYYLYLSCKILFTVLQFVVYRIYIQRKFAIEFSYRKNKVDNELLKDIIKNTKALVFHKIGGIAVFNMDSIIISTLLGVGVLGYYSNYQTIITAEIGLLSLFFTPLTAGIGTMIAEKSKKTYAFYEFLHQINYSLAFLCIFVTFTMINYVIHLWLGDAYIMDNGIVLIIIANYFVDFMRTSNTVFKEAAGLFYPDRYKCIFEAISNLVLSIILCMKIGFIGVILATIITNLIFSLLIEPLVVFKYLFKKPIRSYYLRQYLEVLVFFVVSFGFYKLCDLKCLTLIDALKNGLIGICVSAVVILLSSLTNKGFKDIVKSRLAKQTLDENKF